MNRAFSLLLLGVVILIAATSCNQAASSSTQTQVEEPKLKKPQFPDATQILVWGNPTLELLSEDSLSLASQLSVSLLSHGLMHDMYSELTEVKKPQLISDIFKTKESIIQKYQPGVVVLWFGQEEAWVEGSNENSASKMSQDDFYQSLYSLTTYLQNQNIPTVLITPHPIGKSHERWRYDRISFMAQSVREVANQTSAPLVDAWSTLEALEYNEGFEWKDVLAADAALNPAGTQMIVDGISGVLVYLYENGEIGN